MKKIERDGFRVVILPRTDAWAVNVENAEEVCEQILVDVRRHVAKVAFVSVEHDEVAVCSYCGSEWVGDDDSSNFGCCEKDKEEARAKYDAALAEGRRASREPGLPR